jgi:hypothetical protein
MKLEGIVFTATGRPEFLVQCLRDRIREVAASLPPGQTHLTMKCDVGHPREIVECEKPVVKGKRKKKAP